MSMPINNQSPQQVSSSTPADQQVSANLTAANVSKELKNVQAEVDSAIVKANDPGISDVVVSQLASTFTKAWAQSEKLSTAIDDLTSTSTPKNEITNLQTQLSTVNSSLNNLATVVNSRSMAAVDSVLAKSAPVITPNTPLITVPDANDVDLNTPVTPQEKANLFLLPALSTAIFIIMQKVVKQKLENMDTYREFMQSYIAATEQFALSAAQATLLHGEAEANAMKAQATGQLIGAGLQIAFSTASVMAVGVKMNKINKDYKAKTDAILEDENLALNPQLQKTRLHDIETQRTSSLRTALEGEPALQALKILESAAPTTVNAIATIIGANYKIDAASADAAKMLWQQAIQAAQAIVQELQQGIAANSQDITQFLQAVDGISHSLTQQA